MTPREAAFRLTVLIVVLGTVASAAGLFAPEVYRETEWVLPQVRGQDLVTLAAMPLLLLAALHGRRQHPIADHPTRDVRARLAWAGLMGYVLYTYTAAAFSYHFNELFLVYVALFSCSLFGLAALGVGMDAAEVTPTNFVYVLDLGIIVPLAVLAAIWLRAASPWGYVLTGAVLIKAATMGLALISMTWFSVLAGTDADPYLGAVWVLIAASSLIGAYVFFRHCALAPSAPPQEAFV